MARPWIVLINPLALVATKDAAMPDDAFTMKPGREETLPPGKLGATGNRFLIAKNMSATEKGSYMITIE